MPQEFSVAPLVEAWRRASEDLRREIGQLAADAAERAASRVQAAYPRRTGGLQGSVRVSAPRGWQVSEGAIVPAKRVLVSAPHVHLVEDGTRPRVDSTRKNANRGVMPRLGPIFVPIAVQEREAYLQAAQARLDAPREVI